MQCYIDVKSVLKDNAQFAHTVKFPLGIFPTEVQVLFLETTMVSSKNDGCLTLTLKHEFT